MDAGNLLTNCCCIEPSTDLDCFLDHVVAIDIDERNIKRTRENLDLNNANATVLQIGVSDRTGSASVNTAASYNMRSIRRGDGSNTVFTDTLDHIAETLHIEAIDLVIMDIEGHEVIALQGLVGLL
ncbi:MAG TPA: FkbM family methyltransferase, partial [Nitrososphaera sp.]|nr:FkbM family methyltransferase [Nitrososphaera sp.]